MRRSLLPFFDFIQRATVATVITNNCLVFTSGVVVIVVIRELQRSPGMRQLLRDVLPVRIRITGVFDIEISFGKK